ncbi:MAG: malto-oligosyltrehalose synthase, partial [Oscillochloris sp.]|nr:malto-oligosyltrehalose synthase [Oscillochloris sp.]
MTTSDHASGGAPRATYRLQFHAGFTFADAERIVAYLDDLGVSHAYASPLLTPRAGSTHGYDITDHGALSPDLGGEEGFERLSAALRARRMGLILDVVPNHMGIGDMRNGWWFDVLENGAGSIYAHYFDIDWEPVPRQLSGKVLLPVLGDQYGEVLERGELQLDYADGAFLLRYWEHRFPINPRSYSDLLTYRLDQMIAQHGTDNEDVMELQSILTALKYLPTRNETDPERIAERNREKEIVKRRLDRLHRASCSLRQAIAETLADYNGHPGDPHSFDLLDALLEQQPYRLAFWRVATEEINYRRFFDINDLAAIRVELPEVLDATHQLIFRLLAEGRASGLRIDHPDGLWDPASYFRQLQARSLAAVGRPLYIVAEKILALGEPLPEDWAVAGTTGYDFLNEVNGVFVDQAARRTFDRLYADVAGSQPAYANLVNSKKKEIMLVSLASEINALSHILDELTEHNRRYRDFTLNSLTFAIREVLACLPVYRTYISGPNTVTARDVRSIEAAVRDARRRNPRTAGAIFDFLRDTLTLRNLGSFAAEAREAVLRFVMKLQQISGPVMAKGVEDTSFYVYNRLVSLNEVGGHPEHFGGTVERLHECAAARAQRWPQSMLASSTHDTKRSEDVRARINVIS